MNGRRSFYCFLAALTILRFLWAALAALRPEEAIYWQCAQHLDWSYFSRGPAASVAVWLGSQIGGDSPLGLRLSSPLLALGSTLLVLSIGRRLYSEAIGVWAALLLNLTPAFNLSSVQAGPEALSILCWIGVLHAFSLALDSGPAFNAWWLAAGAYCGLGFLTDYGNGFALVSVAALLATTAKYRREFRRPGIYALVSVWALCAAPVFWWNSQHAWVGIGRVLSEKGLAGEIRLRFESFLAFLGGQMAVWSPLVFLSMLAALAWAARKARAHFKPRVLVAFSLPLPLVHGALALVRSGRLLWTAPAAGSLSVLLVVFALDTVREKVWAKIAAWVGLGFAGLLTVLALHPDLLLSAGIPAPEWMDFARNAEGWQTAAERVQAVRESYEKDHQEPVFLIASGAEAAAALGYYLPRPRENRSEAPPVYVVESAWPEDDFYFFPRYDSLIEFTEIARARLRSGNSLDSTVQANLAAALEEIAAPDAHPTDDARRKFLHALKTAAPDLSIDDYYTESFGYNPFQGRSALYITDLPEPFPPTCIERSFNRADLVASFEVRRFGRAVRQIRIFACSGYHTQEL